MSLSQDLDDYKLRTEFDRSVNAVVHRSDHAHWARGRRRAAAEERWASEKLIGFGTFGTVRLERKLNLDGDSQFRAVKELRKYDLKKMRIDFQKELLALTKFSRLKFVQSGAFVQFLGWFEDTDHVYIAMEYFRHGTLDRFISEALKESDARLIAEQLFEGVRIMHEESFTHRDLKPENIFVVQCAPNWWVKIGDFGISKRVANNVTALHTNCGTPLYLAPEVSHYVPSLDEESEAYTSAVDIWSLACVIYEMLALQPPFVKWPKTLVAFCNGGDFPEAPLILRSGELAIEFVKSILVPLPAKRPTAAQALDSPWFKLETAPISPVSSTEIPKEDPNVKKLQSMRLSSSLAGDPLSMTREEQRSTLLANRSAYKTTVQTPEAFRTAINISQQSNSFPYATPKGGTEIDANIGSTTTRKLGSFIQPRIASSKRNTITARSACDICKRGLHGIYYHCGVCENGNFNICSRCMKLGSHCDETDHWLVKSDTEKRDTIRGSTETKSSGWSLQPIPGTDVRERIPPVTLKTLRWSSSYKKPRWDEVSYDYCYQCRATFPADMPPKRHIQEQHGTEDPPLPPPTNSSTATLLPVLTATWIKNPTVEDEEEEALHREKLRRMEVEMKQVFAEQVELKENRLKLSEEELYARHLEMKNQIERQREELEEKRTRIERRGSGMLKADKWEEKLPTGKKYNWLFGGSK